MIIFDLFKKSLKLVNNNLILIEPLLIFCLLSIIITYPLRLDTGLSVAKIVLIASLGCLLCVFNAGWLNMFHKSIEKDYNNENNENANQIGLIKEFFPGVGQYVFTIAGGIIIYLIFLVIIAIIGIKFIGIPDIFTHKNLLTSIQTEADAIKFINSITPADKIKIGAWDLMILIILPLLSFLTMFWRQAVIALDKNPIAAYWESLKTVAKNPLNSIMIMMAYWATVIFISVIGSLFQNSIFQLVILMLIFFTEVYFTMVAFLYFEKYRKNNSNSRTNSIRED